MDYQIVHPQQQLLNQARQKQPSDGRQKQLEMAQQKDRKQVKVTEIDRRNIQPLNTYQASEIQTQRQNYEATPRDFQSRQDSNLDKQHYYQRLNDQIDQNQGKKGNTSYFSQTQVPDVVIRLSLDSKRRIQQKGSPLRQQAQYLTNTYNQIMVSQSQIKSSQDYTVDQNISQSFQNQNRRSKSPLKATQTNRTSQDKSKSLQIVQQLLQERNEKLKLKQELQTLQESGKIPFQPISIKSSKQSPSSFQSQSVRNQYPASFGSFQKSNEKKIQGSLMQVKYYSQSMSSSDKQTQYEKALFLHRSQIQKNEDVRFYSRNLNNALQNENKGIQEQQKFKETKQSAKQTYYNQPQDNLQLTKSSTAQQDVNPSIQKFHAHHNQPTQNQQNRALKGSQSQQLMNQNSPTYKQNQVNQLEITRNQQTDQQQLLDNKGQAQVKNQYLPQKNSQSEKDIIQQNEVPQADSSSKLIGEQNTKSQQILIPQSSNQTISSQVDQTINTQIRNQQNIGSQDKVSKSPVNVKIIQKYNPSSQKLSRNIQETFKTQNSPYQQINNSKQQKEVQPREISPRRASPNDSYLQHYKRKNSLSMSHQSLNSLIQESKIRNKSQKQFIKSSEACFINYFHLEEQKNQGRNQFSNYYTQDKQKHLNHTLQTDQILKEAYQKNAQRQQQMQQLNVFKQQNYIVKPSQIYLNSQQAILKRPNQGKQRQTKLQKYREYLKETEKQPIISPHYSQLSPTRNVYKFQAGFDVDKFMMQAQPAVNYQNLVEPSKPSKRQKSSFY